jgi:tRNA (mo5U34)-methyltransferase
MPLMKEKRLRLKGWELAIAMEASKAERLRNSLPYRLLRGGVARLSSRGGRTASNGLRNPAANAGPVADSPEAASLREAASRIKWYHALDLGHGVVTSGMVNLLPIADQVGLPADLTGKRCLDVGTYDGFWAFEMERRGAAEVIALDLDSFADYDVPRIEREAVIANGQEWVADFGQQQAGEGIKFAIQAKNSKVRREILNVYKLSPERLGMFDIVFSGYLMVHLRDPQTALENIFSVTKEMAILVEPFELDMEGFNRPISSFLVGESTVGLWWHHNTETWKALMTTAGFDPVEEVSRTKLQFDLGPRDDSLHDVHTIALRGYVPTGRQGG